MKKLEDCTDALNHPRLRPRAKTALNRSQAVLKPPHLAQIAAGH